MATFPTTAPIDAEPTTGHNGGAPPSRDGGDDGSFNYGAAAFDARLRRARLGMIVALSGIAMIFVSFTSAYFVRQGLPTLDIRTGVLFHDWIRVPLPPLFLLNTIVLLISSVTMALARHKVSSEIYSVAGGQGNVKDATIRPESSSGPQISWLAVTIILGLAFLAGQVVAWRELATSGFYLSTSPSSSFVYLLTATHGVHLLAGVLALLFAGAASVMRRPLASQLVIVDVAGWYWHFMAFLWLYIFCLLKFAH